MLIEIFNSGIRVELNRALSTIRFQDLLPATTCGSCIDLELLTGNAFSISCAGAQEAHEACNDIYNLMMAAI